MKEIRHEDMKKRWRSLSEDDWNEIDVQAQILGAILSGRKDKNLTQKELGDLSGVAQTFIARLENFRTDPQLSTILKILRPLGKTLAVVSVDVEEGKEKQKSTRDSIDSRKATRYEMKETDENVVASVWSDEKFGDAVLV